MKKYVLAVLVLLIGMMTEQKPNEKEVLSAMLKVNKYFSKNILTQQYQLIS